MLAFIWSNTSYACWAHLYCVCYRGRCEKLGIRSLKVWDWEAMDWSRNRAQESSLVFCATLEPSLHLQIILIKFKKNKEKHLSWIIWNNEIRRSQRRERYFIQSLTCLLLRGTWFPKTNICKKTFKKIKVILKSDRGGWNIYVNQKYSQKRYTCYLTASHGWCGITGQLDVSHSMFSPCLPYSQLLFWMACSIPCLSSSALWSQSHTVNFSL